MIINKVAICPVCNKKTWLRITDGGYLNEYPIRVYCMNCRALIKGTYIMADSLCSRGLYLTNAYCIDPIIDVEHEIIKNADYVAEISGELPSPKVELCDGSVSRKPVFLEAQDHIDMNFRINQLKQFNRNMSEWKKKKSISFQLLQEGKIEYLAMSMGNKMGKFPYECDNDLKSLHCLEQIMLKCTENLFVTTTQKESITRMMRILSSIDRGILHEFVERIGGTTKLLSIYTKTVDVFSEFMNIYENLLPAETYTQYVYLDNEEPGISTCSFIDIKAFYQDSYEALLSVIFIPVCIDNILLRGDYKKFNEATFRGLRKRGGPFEDDYEWFLSIDNGKKIECIQKSEDIQGIVDMPGNRLLRNGIGHNNIKYDGLTQIITAYDQKTSTEVVLRMSLLDMAVDCLKLARSAVVISEILLFILRQEYQSRGITSIVPIEFYDGIGLYDLCPCGSSKKYKWCCKNAVEVIEGKHSK